VGNFKFAFENLLASVILQIHYPPSPKKKMVNIPFLGNEDCAPPSVLFGVQ